jgi:hypothetical protein
MGGNVDSPMPKLNALRTRIWPFKAKMALETIEADETVAEPRPKREL